MNKEKAGTANDLMSDVALYVVQISINDGVNEVLLDEEELVIVFDDLTSD